MSFDPKELKEARGRFRHTQQAAAEFIEVSIGIIRDWEQRSRRGRSNPKGLYAKAVAAYIRASRRRQ